MYKNVRLNQNDITVQFNDKDNPFMGLRGCGSDFSLNNIQKALMGNGCKLEISGANGKNKYLPFRIDATKGMTESTSKITNLIKENLTKIKREKDSSLLIETKIIKSRTQLLSENRILKFKQPREKFFNEIISEALYLNKQGFDKQIIKEEFWDSLKGLFGEHGSNAIFTTFKEYMGKYLVGKLTSINPSGWMGENIKEAINKIHIEDLDKITQSNTECAQPTVPTHKYKDDKNYQYAKSGDCWWAKNINNNKWFNLTELVKTKPNFQVSIDRLNDGTNLIKL
jgi:hypothetical protein